MHVWGRAKENKAGRSEGNMLEERASNIHGIIEGTYHTPHGGQQANHSPAAKSGRIQMHVWCCEKENQAGRLEGHMRALPASHQHIWATRAHNIHRMPGSKPSLTSCTIRGDPDACVG